MRTTKHDPAHVADRLLSGWGRTPTSLGHIATPLDEDDVQQLMDRADSRGVIPRGLGRSYGDAAQRGGGLVLDMTQINDIGIVDEATGSISVGAGVSFDTLLREVLPKGWFVPVTPGTRFVTMGGAVAADIHGKNHHHDGSFSNHVTSMTLVTPTGVHTVTSEGDPDLFWATAGGMGLTGVITQVTVRLRKVETSWVSIDTQRFSGIEELMGEMETNDHNYDYSVAWIDCNAGGKRRGRSVLTRGTHADLERLKSASCPAHRELSRPRLKVPRVAPKGLPNVATVAAFNELMFRRAPQRRLDELQHIGKFFHPLDGVAQWNLLYGPNGFLQYQFAVGENHAHTVIEAIRLVGNVRIPSFVSVLKRFGPGNSGLLSFPIAGWTLALDFPIGSPSLPRLVRTLDEIVINSGGRVYLAKDSSARAEEVHHMYPRIPQFEAVRDRIDPARILQSDLSRRLEI